MSNVIKFKNRTQNEFNNTFKRLFKCTFFKLPKI